MVVIQIRGQKSLEMPFVDDNDVIEKFSAKATYQPFNVSILPRRSRRGDNLVNPQTLQPSSNALSVNAIAVSQQIPRSRIKWKRFHDLLGPSTG